MMPFQVNDQTYFIDEKFFWDNFDKYTLDEFVQIIMSGNYLKVDLNDSFNAEIINNRIEHDKNEFLED